MLNVVFNENAVDGLKKMDACSVNTCITSPPYYGLRDYGVYGQIGLEETPEDYIKKLVDVFREVRRVLRDDGTLWVNIGDSYTGSANAGGENSRTCESKPNARDKNLPTKKGVGLKTKDLIGIPWMLAFALRADGWYLRQDIIWSKTNPMPESVTDRCTKSHEYIFLLSKSAHYYYDAESIKEPANPEYEGRYKSEFNVGIKEIAGGGRPSGKNTAGIKIYTGKRNKRDVWTVSTKGFKGAHFAVYPEELITPCVLAGCPAGGVVLDPFMGSGTTAVVAIENNRNYVGCEINPAYVKIIEKRVKKSGYQTRL